VKKERRFSLEGHKLYYVLCAYWLFYVHAKTTTLLYFYGSESWLQGSKPWRYSLKFHRRSEKQIRHKS